jgi:putative MATE family efflux protein
MKDKLITGHPLKTLIMFALPYLLSSFLQTFYGMADLYIVGQFYGASSISAVSIGSQFMHMITVIFIGLAMGTTVKLGHAIGGNNEDEVSSIIGNTFILFVGIALLFTIIFYFNTSLVTQIMSTPKEAIIETNQYLKICFIGIPFIIAYNVFSSIFRGLGDSKRPMYFIFIACILNIILDYLLVGTMSLGTIGAAFATVIAQAVSSIVAFIWLLKKDIQIHTYHFKIYKDTIKGILTSGIPIALQDGFIQVSFLIITIIANSRGLIPATSVGIVEKIISFLFLVPSALLSSLSALIAHNIGAKQYKRADTMLKYALIISVSFACICFIMCQIIPGTLIGFFTKDQQVIQAGIQYLKSYALDCIFAAIHFCFTGYFNGSGYSTISFIHNTISIILVRIPGAYFASKLFPNTLFPMGLAAPIGSLLSSIICIIFFIYIRKNKRTILQ